MNEQELFDECIERAKKILRKHMPDTTVLTTQEFEMAFYFFKQERELNGK